MQRCWRTAWCGLRGVLGLASALLGLWSSGVLADGSAEVEVFPLTGAYRATHREDRDGVAIIDFVGDYARTLPGGRQNIEARAVVAQEFFRTHPDQYDFLVLFSTFDFQTGEAAALHWGVQNTVQGIGIAPYNVAHLFGSAGRLLGYIDMAALSRHVLDPLQPRFEDTLSILGHEVLHQWSGRARFLDAQGQVSYALLGRNGAHWSDLLDTNASVLYGHKWRDNRDGTFTSEAVRKFLSPLDLYLAGWYRADEVPPFVLIDSPGHDPTLVPQPGLTLPGTARVITIDDVIAAEGPRVPAAGQAQRVFRFAWILLTSTDTAVDTVQLSAMAQVRNAFAERFAVWTGGRGLVVSDAAVSAGAPVGSPDTLRGAPVRPEPAALETALREGLHWLRQQQQADGSWQDHGATRVRDTALTLETLLRLDPAFTGQAPAVTWLHGQTPESTDARARQLQALAMAGEEVAGLREALLGLRHTSGGWGAGAGYAPAPLDTALVLVALAQAGHLAVSDVEPALDFLRQSQHGDGGWSALAGGPSRVGVTTLVVQALHLAQRLQPGLEAACAWLASQQQADGGFGAGSSTVHETAQVLQSMIVLGRTAHIRPGEAAAYLLARQQTDGSWGGSTYATALVLGALKRLYFSNWHIESDVQVSLDQPVDGELLTLRLQVRNDGQSPTLAGVVRLYGGEPTSGARPLLPDVAIPVLAPGASVTLLIPWDTFGAAGMHTLVAVVDPDQTQGEVSEQDNRVVRPLTVQAAPAGLELALESLMVLPERPDTLPTVLGISAIVRNVGLSSAAQVRVQLREIEQQRLVAEGTYEVPARSSIPVMFTDIVSAPGRLTFSLTVDPEHVLPETSKANNTALKTIETLPSVDLQVSPGDILVTPQPILRGTEVTFAVRLHNTGTSLSPPTTVQYVVTDGQSAVHLGEHTLQIEAGGTLQRSLTWRAPHTGLFTFTVHLDPAHLVPETQTQNNRASVAFEVGAIEGPNLAVHFQDVTLSPEPGLAGQALTMTALVSNTGTAEARQAVVAFYDGDPSQGGQEVARQTLPVLAPDTSMLVNAMWPRLPERARVLLFVRLDPEERIAEFRETDNTAFRSLEVLSLPDLALSPADIRLTPGFPVRGQPVQVEVQVHNLGQQPAHEVTVSALEGDRHGLPLGAAQRVSVPGESSRTVQWLWTPGAAADLSGLTVVLDPEQALYEQSTLNNIAQKRVAVQDGDVFVSQRYISPNGDGVQDSTSFFFRVALAEPVEVVVLDQRGTLVRQLQSVTQTSTGSVEWDGLDQLGRVVRDGSYRLQVRRETGNSLGEAQVVVDTNRSSLLEAIGTPFASLTNLTCHLGHVRLLARTEDEQTIFLLVDAATASAAGLYRMQGNGTGLTLLLPLQANDLLHSLQISPQGTFVALIGRLAVQGNQESIVVMQGDGSNLRAVPLAQQPQDLVAVLPGTSEVVVLARERSAPFRQQLLAVPIFGGSPRLLYSAPDVFTGLTVHGLSPRRDALVLRVGSPGFLTYYVLPLFSGAPRQIAVYDVRTLAFDSFLPDEVPWSPDGTRLALKHLELAADGRLTFALLLVDTQGHVLRRIVFPLQGNDETCVSLASDNLAWSPDGQAIAFDLVQEGVDECRSGDVYAGGLYVADTRSGTVQQVLAFDARSRGYAENTRHDRLSWFPDERALLYGLVHDDVVAVLLDEDNRRVALQVTGQGIASTVEEPRLSASGRQVWYRDAGAVQHPQSACYQPGSMDEWSYRSLLNLTAEMQASRQPDGGAILFQGTVSDRHLESYGLEYAVSTAPDVWYVLQPPSSQMVVQDTLALWIPPGPGTYLVRLRATDLAGNQRQQLLRVVWAERTRLSDLSRTAALFSPNGDQTLEDVSLRYRVLEPAHLRFDIVNEAGELVRRLARDHATVGALESVVWDGRDDYGLLLPDGLYQIQVDNLVLPVRLDTTPPGVTLALQAPFQPLVSPQLGTAVQVAPSLHWSITEPYYHRGVIETATTAQPDVWHIWRDLGPPASGDGTPQEQSLRLDRLDQMLFRLRAEDLAGNRTVVQVGPVPPQLIVAAFGEHRLNDKAQECLLSPQGPSELLSCVQDSGGYYHPLALLPYAPLGALDVAASVGNGVFAVTTPTARFTLAETIPRPLTQVFVQYRAVEDVLWQEAPLRVFLNHAVLPASSAQPFPERMDVVWEVPALPSDVLYVARLKAIDDQQQEYVSNPLRLQSDAVLVLHGLLSEATQAERQNYHLPFLLQGGKTGVWALNVSHEALREVRLLVQSADDPRYHVPREAARVTAPEQVIIFATDLTACKSYEVYALGTTLAGMPRRSRPQHVQVPCLNLAVQVEPVTGTACDAEPVQRLQIQLAPESRSGAGLKLLTLARLDATGQEDIVFNVNRPQGVSLPRLEAAPPTLFIYDTAALHFALPGGLPLPYVYTYETSALPEGRVELLVRLVDTNDAAIALPIDILVDRTPPTLEVTMPPDGARVCGLPVLGQDGQLRNVVTLEGQVADVNGVHYTVHLGTELIHDSRQVNSFAAALGLPVSRLPPLSAFHTPRQDGPLAQLVGQQGAVGVQLRVFDWGGFQRCTARTLVIDGRVEVEAPQLSQVLFSPNGDGLADDVTLSYQVDEPSRLDLLVYAATRDQQGQMQSAGTALRQVESLTALAAGRQTARWDGHDATGRVVSDGWYGLVSVLTDACGNQQRYEAFVEVDTTPPQVVIEAPQAHTPLALLVAVSGSVHDPHLSTYRVQVGGGTGPQTWAVLSSGTTNMAHALLAQWNTLGLDGPFVIRLSAQDQAGNSRSVDVPVTLSARVTLLNALTALPSLFSPQSDGQRDHLHVSLGLAEEVLLTVTVQSAGSLVLRTLASNQVGNPGVLSLLWDGLQDTGVLVPDGVYTVLVRAVLRRAPTVTQEERLTVTVDTTPPQISITRPAQGFVTGLGQVQGSITDAHLREYRVLLTEGPGGLQNTLLSSGNSPLVEAPLGSLQGMPEGAYTLTVEARDSADNTASARLAFVVDNTPPLLELLQPVAGSVVGREQAPIVLRGRLTESHLERYQLQVGAGSEPLSWTVLQESVRLPEGQVLGHWDLSGVDDGPYTLRLLVQDKAGLHTEKRLTLLVDQTPPSVALTTPADGALVAAALPITGTVLEAHLASYRLELAPESTPTHWSLLGTGTTAGEHQLLLQWRALPPDGVYILRLTALDQAANTAATLRHIRVDRTPPARLEGLTAILEAQQVRLGWQPSAATDLAGYTVYRDGQRLTPVLLGVAAYEDVGGSEGRYTYTVTASDQAGLESEPSPPVTLTLDRTPPQVHLSAPLPGATVSGLVEVTGSVYSPSDFKVYRLSLGVGEAPLLWQLLRQSPVPVQAEVLSQWNTAGLPEGALYSLQLEGEDLSGNLSTARIVVRIDNQAPAAPTGVVATRQGTRVQLTWQANNEADLLGYLVYRNARLLTAGSSGVGDVRALAVRTSAYTDPVVVDGSHTYTVVALDQAGNASAPSVPVAVPVNERAPRAQLLLPRPGSVFDGALSLLASVGDEDVAQVQFHYKAAAAVAWELLSSDTAAPYEATFHPAGLGLAFGTYQLRALAMDTSQRTDPAPEVRSVTYADRTRPGPVQGLAVQVDGDSVRLQWSPTHENDLTGYYVERQQDDAAPVRLHSLPLPGTSYVDTGLAEATYRYTVTAVDRYMNLGPPAVAAPVLVYTPHVQRPRSPTTVPLLTVAGQGTPQALVSAQRLAAQQLSPLPPTTADATGAFTLANVSLSPGENHLTVQLMDPAGQRSKPATLTIVLAQAPSPPTGLTVAVSGTSTSLSWQANPEADIVGYRLWRDGAPVLADLLLIDGTLSAGGRLLTWPEARQVTRAQVQWASAVQPASAFDLEAWSGHHWVTLAQRRGNQQHQHMIPLSTAYRTTQLRLVELEQNEEGLPWSVTLQGLYAPLIPGIDYAESLADGHYVYHLTAVNAAGLESAPSVSVPVAVGDVLAPEPVHLTATGLTSAVRLQWTPSPALDVQHYDITRNGLGLTSIAADGPLQYVDADLLNGVYTYTVTVSDRAGNTSAPSNQARVSIAAPLPAAPQNVRLQAAEAGGVLELQWSPGEPGQSRFRVLRSLTPGGPYTALAELQVTSLTDTGLMNGTTYSYVVLALDALGNASTLSAEVSGTPRDWLPPAAPRLYFPTVPGRPVSTEQPEISIIGLAEPAAQVQLLVQGQRIASTMAQSSDTVLEISLPGAARPLLSPDGRYVAFVEPGVTGQEEEDETGTGSTLDRLRLYDSVTRSIDEVALAPALTSLRWAPDSTILLFAARDPAFRRFFIQAYELAQKHLRQLTDPAETDMRAAVPSPHGGQQVLYGAVSGQYGLWLEEGGSGNYTPLSPVSSADAIEAASVHWSPDGKFLAYRKQGAYEIIARATGQSRRVDTQASAYAPAWAPDSQSLAYTVLTPDAQLRVYDLRTGTVRTLGAGLAPQWTADAQRLLSVAPTATALLGHEPGTAEETTLLQAAALAPETLQVVPTGFIGVLQRHSAALTVYRRLEPAGRFALTHVALDPGENTLLARALDASGNRSAVSEALTLTYVRGPQADLVLTAETVVVFPAAPTVGEPTRVSVTVRNDGTLPAAATTLSLMVLDAAGQSTVLFDHTMLAALAAGESRTYEAPWIASGASGQATLVAVVDPDDVVREQSEANNVVVRDVLVVSQAAPTVTLKTDALLYQGTQPVQITGEVRNAGAAWSGRVRLSVTDPAGFILRTLQNTPVLALGYGESLPVQATWESGGTLAGAYEVRGQLLAPHGDVIASAVAPFRLAEMARLEATVSSDRSTYSARSNVRLLGTLVYTAGNHVLSAVALQLRILDAHAVTLTSSTTLLGDLFPGMTVSLPLDWHTGALQPGVYQAHLDVTQGEQVLTQAQSVLRITPEGRHVTGQLQLSEAAPAPGRVQQVTATLHNQGNSPLARVPVLISLSEVAGGRLVQEQRLLADLAVAGASTLQVEFATVALALQSYRVLLQLGLDDGQAGEVRQTLASQTFVVTDRTGPQIAVVAPMADAFLSRTGSVTLAVQDELSSVARTEWRLDGGAWYPALLPDPSTGRYEVTLPQVVEGPHTLEVRATDSVGNVTLSPALLLHVDATAPQITVTGVREGAAYAGAVTPVIEITEDHPAETHITLNGLPFASGTPVTAEGTYQLVVSASDQAGNQAGTVVHFHIDTTPPVITVHGVEDNAVYMSRPYLYQVAVTDPDGDPLWYGLPVAPSDMRIDGQGRLVWWPQQPGEYAITVRVEDVEGAAAIQAYRLSVAVANLAPVILSVPPAQGRVQERYVYALEAVDPNGDALSYRLESAPPGMQIDALTGLLTWMPTLDEEVVVHISVQDTAGATASQLYTLRISSAP
ncbi:MAG: CARDB domain-containing protein [Candidatus Tectimicrobiota bacterium]